MAKLAHLVNRVQEETMEQQEILANPGHRARLVTTVKEGLLDKLDHLDFKVFLELKEMLD